MRNLPNLFSSMTDFHDVVSMLPCSPTNIKRQVEFLWLCKKGLSVKRRVGAEVGIYLFFLKNAVLRFELGLGLTLTLTLTLTLSNPNLTLTLTLKQRSSKKDRPRPRVLLTLPKKLHVIDRER